MKDDELFHIIEDANVILLNKGVYRQAKVYWRGNRLYAGMGAGFIRLAGHGVTSMPKMSYETLDLPTVPGVRIDKGACGEPLWVFLETVKRAA